MKKNHAGSGKKKKHRPYRPINTPSNYIKYTQCFVLSHIYLHL